MWKTTFASLSPYSGISAFCITITLAWTPCVGDPDTVEVGFQAALELALERNISLEQARLQADLQQALHTQQYFDLFPDAELSADYTRSFGRSFSQEEGRILSQTSDFSGVDFSATMVLFNGFEHFASLSGSGLEKQAQALRRARLQQAVLFSVLQDFIEYLRNRELAQVRRQELQAQDDLLGQVRGMVDAGRQPISDLLQQQAVRAEATVALAESERQVEIAKTRLMQTLMLDPLRHYRFTVGDSDSLTVEDAGTQADTMDWALPHLVEIAMENRADLGEVEKMLHAEKKRLTSARAGYWPSLSLSLGYGSDWSSESEPAYLEQLDNRRGGFARLGLTVPLFDRLQARTETMRARVGIEETSLRFEELKQAIALQVRQALVDHRSSQTQLMAASEGMRYAGEARTAARKRYELGAATFVEVAQAESGFVAAQSARVRAAYNVLLTRKQILYTIGRIDPRQNVDWTLTGEEP